LIDLGWCAVVLIIMNGLRLDLSLRQYDGSDTLETTYRDEGLSVGADHMVRVTNLGLLSIH